MLQFLLLIVWMYLSIAFTLFFMTLMEKDKDMEKIKEDMKKRDIKLNKILHLSYKIDTQLHLKK